MLGGDFDGDGARDLWASRVYADVSYADGSASAYSGPLSGTYDTADAARFWAGSHHHAMLGIDADLLGDVDGDGRGDVLTQVEAVDSHGEFPLVPGSLVP